MAQHYTLQSVVEGKQKPMSSCCEHNRPLKVVLDNLSPLEGLGWVMAGLVRVGWVQLCVTKSQTRVKEVMNN